MSTINWKIFELKYNQREQQAFEDLSYLLFCAELDNRIGLFRYKNQAGLETEPMTKDGIVYGFQAKYYTTSISKNKGDIIDSIIKAKRENPTSCKLYFYLSQKLSESSKIGVKKPKYQIDIEKSAQDINIEIEWRVPSHFELQLALPENKYIYDLFFSLDPNAGDLIDEVKKHTDNLFQSIQSGIEYNGQQIKINRTQETGIIEQIIAERKHLIISGEGGCGKTAIVKDFYYQHSEIPICLFKATEINVHNINDLFRFAHSFTFDQFLDTYQSESKKLFIIDSSEKLAEFDNIDILQMLIRELQNNNWTIVFTTRYGYLNDLQFHIKQTYKLLCEIIHVNLLTEDEVYCLSETYNFTLPHNLKFKDRLRNLFYLNDYLQEYSTIDQNSSFSSFINKIWKKKIQNSGFQKDNIHIEREKCILKIAKERCHTGAFYINAEGLDETALSKLKQDDILGYEDNFGGYFITHDIYEEWALEKIISRDFANFIDANNFFEVLGESLPMRRALRLWLSDKISENIDAVNNFVNDTLSNKNISQFWKDEIIISILLSNYSNAFFAQYESEMTDDNFKLLDRTLFLLRIACTKITGTDNFEDTEIIKTAPIGNGWNTIILFIYQHKEQYFETHLKLILPILSDWVNANKIGDSTHYAGLLALSLVEKRANTKNFYIEKDVEETILKIIYNAAYELQSELKQIFDNVLKNRWVKHNSPYEELCSTILEKPYYGIEVIKTLPESIIQLCDLFWKKTQDEDEKRFPSHSYEMEYRYGLTDKYNFDYFPASALQTPINWLLQVSPKKTIDFIIDFTNYSVECYRQSDYGRENIEEIVLHIDEKKEVKQYLSWALWGMYRGVGSPVVPYLLQSIHMALERFLLELSSTIDSQAIEYVLISILDKSKSASLTAIVCSVVLAYPDKFWKVALILFKTIELFHMDSIRCQNEFEAKSLYSIGGLPQKLFYSEERLKTCQDKHRSTNLESLCVNYQFFGIKGFTEKENNNFIDAIYSIIDNHKSNIQSRIKNEQVTYGILLTRMDRRTMHPTIKEQDDSHTIIELNPELSPELKKHSEDSMNLYNSQMKYITLSLWSKYKSENNKDAVNYPQYDNNPQKALQEAKEILTTIKENATQLMPMDEYIPAFVCAALIRSYSTQLSSQELDFCKNTVLECISMVFDDTYRYQISDGVEACVHALPQIIELFPEESQYYQLILLFILFDNNKIGEYKRLCDYAIETFFQENLWGAKRQFAKCLLYAYINTKPIFNKRKEELSSKKPLWEQGWYSRQEVLSKTERDIKNWEFDKVRPNSESIFFLSVEDMEILFQLIPDDTQDAELLDIVNLILPKLSSLLVREDKDNNSYTLRSHVFRKFANVILNREVEKIPAFIAPFAEKISGTEESKSFITELILAEDRICNSNQFWEVWKLLYEPIIKWNLHGYRSKDVIIEYMLAWQWWPDGIEEWHSLKEQNISFYANISKDLGQNPSVLYSISKVLNSIGRHFAKDGIIWIYRIVSSNKNLELKDLESNTLFYLERLMSKYIYMRTKKKSEKMLSRSTK